MHSLGITLSMFESYNIPFLFKYKTVDVKPENFAIWVLFTLNGLIWVLKFIFLLSFLSELFWGKEWTGWSYSLLLFGYVKKESAYFLFILSPLEKLTLILICVSVASLKDKPCHPQPLLSCLNVKYTKAQRERTRDKIQRIQSPGIYVTVSPELERTCQWQCISLSASWLIWPWDCIYSTIFVWLEYHVCFAVLIN